MSILNEDFYLDQPLNLSAEPEQDPEAIQAGAEITLDEEVERTLLLEALNKLHDAESCVEPVRRQAAKNEKAYKMRKEKKNPKDIELTTPMTYDRVINFQSQISQAMNRKPLYEHGGCSTPDGQESAIISALMQKILEKGRSTYEITHRTPRYASKADYSAIEVEIVPDPEYGYIPQLKARKIEDIFTTSLDLRDCVHSTVGVWDKYELYKLEKLADQGGIRRNALEKIKRTQAYHTYINEEALTASFETENSQPSSVGENQNSPTFTRDNFLDGNYPEDKYSYDPTSIIEFVRMYTKLNINGETKSVRILISVDFETILSLTESPFNVVADHPPIFLMTFEEDGLGPATRLEPLQRLQDTALKLHVIGEMKIVDPPIVINPNSVARAIFEEGFRPGTIIESERGIREGDIHQIEMKRNPSALGLAQIASSLSEDMPSPGDLGGGSRQTQYEVGVRASDRGLVMALFYDHMMYQLDILGEYLWGCISEFTIKPRGAIKVPFGDSFKIISYEGMNQKQLGAKLNKAVNENFQPDPRLNEQGNFEYRARQTAEIVNHLDEHLTNGKIPSSKNPNITVSIHGTKLSVNRETLARNIERAFVTIPLFQSNVAGVLNFLYDYFEALGFPDPERYLGDIITSGELELSEEVRGGISQFMEAINRRSSQ